MARDLAATGGQLARCVHIWTGCGLLLCSTVLTGCLQAPRLGTVHDCWAPRSLSVCGQNTPEALLINNVEPMQALGLELGYQGCFKQSCVAIIDAQAVEQRICPA